MIKSFKHKGLKQLFEKGILSGVFPKDASRINDRLQAIDSANVIDDLDIFTFNLHQLKGERVNIWSITIPAN
ncbi:type II toxin-antitoxin system RelE/ParE family toxin [Providencia vermicola]|uniref:type II toxin-antitoxin system RelE/ParE family toxin n=1 Tax=Providencia vermicola TaxID=333965 RepID=UPI0032DAC5A0